LKLKDNLRFGLGPKGGRADSPKEGKGGCGS
jgi:hypothetical protein